ncbi:MAG: hypothetical protein AAF685_07020 [Cyanobacteria bacterium P01_C01_bin.89]
MTMKRHLALGGLFAAAAAIVGGFAAPAIADWDNPQPENDTVRIRFQNDYSRSIYSLAISPRRLDDWQDLLGSDIVKSRDSIDLELNYTELRNRGCEYRIRAVYSDGSTALLEDPPYNLCRIRHVKFGARPSANPYRPEG